MRDFMVILLKNKLKTNGRTLLGLIFGLLVVMLFPLTLGPNASEVKIIAPAVLWIAVTLTSLLVLPDLYKEFNQGMGDYYFRSPHPLPVLISCHIFIHWLITFLPLVFLTPLMFIFLLVPFEEWVLYTYSLIPGSILFCLYGAMIAALSLSSKRGNMLNAVILLPLFLPVLILGVSSILLGVDGHNFKAPILWLWGMVFVLLPCAPWVSAKILEMSLKR